MAKKKDVSQMPATNVKSRENQLVNKAVLLAEKMIDDGTAPPSVIVHYLKLGATDGELNAAKTREEVKLLKAKTKQIADIETNAQIAKDAARAMSTYSGQDDNNGL